MNLPQRKRHAGGVDTFDVVLGIVILVFLPAIVWVCLRVGGVKTTSNVNRFRQYTDPAAVRDLPPVKPDDEEIKARLKHCRDIYKECALLYLTRARTTESEEMKELEKAWAHVSLSKLRAELSGLDALIRKTKTEGRFGGQLIEIEKMLREVESGLKETAPTPG